MDKVRIERFYLFERASGERLAAAERLLRWFCATHAGSLTGLDVGFDGPRRELVAIARLTVEEVGGADERRMAFWAARAGGRVLGIESLSPQEWRALQDRLARCDVRAIGLDAATAPAAIAAIATAAGLESVRRGYADERPCLTLDIGGPGWDGVRWNADEEALFVASPLAPPLGDPVLVQFRLQGRRPAAVEWARVVAVRTPAEAVPGQPAGFMLGLATAPAALKRQLARSAPSCEYGSRAAPRYAFARPLDCYYRQIEDGTPSRFTAAAWIENLSLGGAFLRTASPPEAGAPIEVAMVLPNGARVVSRATVAFRDVRGMGIRFEPEKQVLAALHEALTQLAARPRRALVVDDEALARTVLSDALVERGFDVLAAGDAEEGLRILAEELLTLDLLVTDQFLPGTLGEEFVARIRGEGGERELVIAVVTGSPDATLAERLRRAGADLLLGKDLGPEIIAMKCDDYLRARIAGLPERGLARVRCPGVEMEAGESAR